HCLAFSTLLFLPRYCDHRDLHSFPTRRSSDLSAGSAPSLKPFFARGRRTRGEQKREGTHATELAQASRLADSSCRRRGGRRRAGDRKSTRLNSSHLGISYAVFCLKKKTN